MTVAHDVHGAAGAAAWLLPIVVLGVVAGSYLLGVAARRRQGRRWSRRRTASFLAGAAAVCAALSPVLETAAAVDPRGHMAQHLLLGMYGPLGLVLGAPVTLLLGAVPAHRRSPVVLLARVLRTPVLHVLTHPGTAGLLSTGGLYAIYLTPLYALSVQSAPVHHLVHVHLLRSGYLLAWSLAGPDPAPRRAGMRARVVVLVLTAGAHAALAKLLYARAGEVPPGAAWSAEESRQAARLMYSGGDVVEVLLAVALFSWWFRRRSGARRRGGHGSRPPASAVRDHLHRLDAEA